MNENTITIETPTSLKKRYPGQTNPQPCFVELDCEERVLRAAYDPEIDGAVPMRAWHGINQRFSIPCLTVKEATNLLREIRPLAEIVCDGFERVWNGSNHVARFTEDAKDVLVEISSRCDRCEK